MFELLSDRIKSGPLMVEIKAFKTGQFLKLKTALWGSYELQTTEL